MINKINFQSNVVFIETQWDIFCTYICLVHLPGQNIFCPGQIWNCPRQNFCPGLKSPFFTFKSYSKWNFLIGRVSKNHFHLQMLILNNFGNQKMDFLTLDKIFVLDNLNIVLDKKYFVRADGRGISYSKSVLAKSWAVWISTQ